MRKMYLLWAFCLLSFVGNAQSTYNRIFITEYLQSSGSQDALAIGNYTSSEVNLSRLRISIYYNGTTAPATPITLTTADDGTTTIIPPQKTFVFYSSGTSTPVMNPSVNLPNTTTATRKGFSTSMNYSGNDAIKVEYKNDNGNWTTVDIFGKIGQAPTAGYWNATNLQTQNRLLSRKPNILAGVTSNPADFSITLAKEWIDNNNNIAPATPFTVLGNHLIQLPFVTKIISVPNVRVPHEGGGPPYQTMNNVPTTVLAETPRESPLSQYGGSTEMYVGNNPGFFTTRKDPVTGVWNFVDPDGYLFYSIGVDAMKLKSAYPGISSALAIRDSLKANTLGAFSLDSAVNSYGTTVPYTHLINMAAVFISKTSDLRRYHLYEPHRIYPIFDDNWPSFCDSIANARLTPMLIDDKFNIGYFSDNELQAFSPGALARYTNVANYADLGANDPTYIAVLNWLSANHTNHQPFPTTSADAKAFTGFFAERYFKYVSEAIKKRDPNHLYLGSKFTESGIKDTLLYSTAGKYCDVVSVDYYRRWAPDTSETNLWYSASKKPFIIAEFGAKADDAGPNYINNLEGASYIVNVQQNRGDFLENFATNLMKIKACIGYHWFVSYDFALTNPVYNAPPNSYSNKGIINNQSSFYIPLKNSFRELALDNYNLRNWLLGNTIGQKINFGALPPKTAGDAPFAISATATSMLPVSFISSDSTVAKISGNIVTIVGGGTTVITAIQAGDQLYSPADSVSQQLTVNKKTQTIVFNALPDKTFGAAPFTLVASTNATGAFIFKSSNTSVATISGNTVTVTSAGATDITALNNGDSFYKRDSVIQHLTINKANQTITFNPIAPSGAKFLLDSDFGPGATTSSGLAITYTSSNSSVATILSDKIQLIGAGTANIIAHQAGNTNYNPAANQQQMLSVTADTIINVAADAYVRDFTYANVNYGTATALTIKNYLDQATPKTGFYREAYLRFDLSSLAHNGGSISSANLKLTFSTSSPSLTLTAFPVSNDTWGENTITYNNKPAYGSTSSGSAAAATHFVMNLTNYMNSELATANHLASLCLKDNIVNNNVLVQFSSKEDATVSNRPVLAITVSKQIGGGQSFTAQIPQNPIVLDNSTERIPTNNQNEDATGIVIYPNPATSVINIKVPDTFKTKSIRVYDAYGNLKISQNSSGELNRIDVSSFSLGVYLINLYDGQKTIIKKFIKSF